MPSGKTHAIVVYQFMPSVIVVSHIWMFMFTLGGPVIGCKEQQWQTKLTVLVPVCVCVQAVAKSLWTQVSQ